MFNFTRACLNITCACRLLIVWFLSGHRVWTFLSVIFLHIFLFWYTYVFLIHMSVIWLCVMSCVWWAGQLACHFAWQKLKCWTLYTKTVQPTFFIPAMLVGSIDLYYFVPPSLTLTMSGGHKVSAKENLLVSFSCTLFIGSGWNLIWWWGNWSWASWDYWDLLKRRGITAVFLTTWKNM